MAVLLSVNVGLPRDVPWQGKTVHTGIWKEPVPGQAMVRRLNIDGDGQGDLAGHGGEQRAVMVYQIDSYRHWEQHLGRHDFSYGQFGENLTIDGLADSEVCIGDRYRIGEAEFEVTQPRVTCYRVGMRLGEPQMPALLVSHHRPGFYLRVLCEGHIQAGDEIVKTATGPGALSVADTDALLYLPGRDDAKLRLAVQIPALSPGWQQSFRDLIDAAARGGPAAAPPPGTEPGARPGPAWTGFRPLRVTKIRRETAGVSSIYLAASDGSPLPSAQAGLYITMRVAGAGRDGQPDPVRSYSLSSPPGDGVYRISVKAEGPASQYLVSTLRAGSTVEVAAPRGEFVLDDGSGPVLLISAGIGVTPVLSMLHQLAAAHSQREVWWIYSARRPREHPLLAEARDLLKSLPGARVHLFYSQATPAELRGKPAVAGHVTADALAALGLPANGQAYVCGPAGYMTDVRDALDTAGIGPDRVHMELFAALPATRPGVVDGGAAAPAPHPPVVAPGSAGSPATGPMVTFARSGVATPFADTWHSLLDLADACDVPSRWSCRTGVCHTCVTPLLSGDVAYSPEPLEPPSEGQVLICCSQPRSDIVLDM